MSLGRRLTVLAAAGGATVVARRRAEQAARAALDQSGRTAVVTGAGSGIGRALALLLAERGATVHAVDVQGPAVELVVTTIRDAGGTAHAHTVDVADPDAVAALADRVFALGPVDLLFNNAGVGHAGAVVDTPLADWQRVIEVNLLGVVHGVHAFLPRLVAQQRPAHIVNTASLAGLMPVPGLVPYSTTKAALVGMSDALDAELAGTGVRVSALCPGIIDTAIVATSTMRGPWAEKQDATAERYAQRGTAPQVVARDALEGIARGLPMIASPRSQVLPAWAIKRASPTLSRAVARWTTRALGGQP